MINWIVPHSADLSALFTDTPKPDLNHSFLAHQSYFNKNQHFGRKSRILKYLSFKGTPLIARCVYSSPPSMVHHRTILSQTHFLFGPTPTPISNEDFRNEVYLSCKLFLNKVNVSKVQVLLYARKLL